MTVTPWQIMGVQPSPAQLTTQQCKPEQRSIEALLPRLPPSPYSSPLAHCIPSSAANLSSASIAARRQERCIGRAAVPSRHSHFARELLLTRYSVVVAPGNRLHRKEASFPYRSPPRLEPFQPTARPADREARRKPRTKEPGRPPPKEQIACGRALTSANCGAWIPGEIVFTWHI